MTDQANPNPAAPAAEAPRLTGELSCAYAAPSAFSPAECDRILALSEGEALHDGLVHRAGEGIQHDLRKCRVIGLYPTDEQNRWIMQRIIRVCSDFNNLHFGFDITSVGLPLQLTQYPAGGEYSWHMDIGGGELRKRKISFSLQLSEAANYDGGEFETALPAAVATRERGSLIVFPSFVPHRVAPVTRGERWALVGWILGPEWR